MASFIKPIVIDEDPAPPWGWNPIATFQTAFNDAQENKRAQEKMALEMELAEILLPTKRAEAEYNLKKFTLDAQLLEKMHKTKSAALDASYRGITSAIGGGGGRQGGSGSGNTVQQDTSNDPLSFNIPTATPQNQPTAVGGSSYKLGSGLQPIPVR